MRIIRLALFTLSFCLFLSLTAQAQYPILDQEPASQKWYQAKTSQFNILFPEGNDSVAISLARKLQSWHRPLSVSLEAYPKKLSVVLRNQTTVPNGFVTLAPRRSEFFTMPPQDYNFTGTNQWLDLLAIHEFRHVVQFEKAKTGFNKFLYYAFGEEALAGMSFLAVPQWFWEGDAVAMETLLTPSGRGRIPEFDMVFRTNLLERSPFSYSKQYLRSFKDYVPDHYVTGYFMVSHLRRKYAHNPWNDILAEAFGKPFIPFTFSRAIKKETGKNVVGTYREMVVELDSIWTENLESRDTTLAIPVTTGNRKKYTNYMYPQVSLEGKIVALKSGIGDITQLVTIDPENEENTEFVTGFIANSGMLSAQEHLVVWNEYRPDLRWGARSKNEIKLYNLPTGKIRSITGPSRYSAAALSPDLTRIATIHTSETNDYSLVLLEVESGKEIFRFPNPENHFLAMPRWGEDGKSLVALKTTVEGKTIIFADVTSGTMTDLFPPSQINYGHPVKYGNYVLYNAAHSSVDNIYAFDISTGNHYQVTSRPFGAFNPEMSKAGDTLYFNDYQVDGMMIAKTPFSPGSWKPFDWKETILPAYIDPAMEEESIINLQEDESIDVQVDRYNRLKNLFNIHSWGILLTESGNELAMGLRSQNILSTNILSAGYAFNPYENAGYLYGRYSYQGWFPVIDLAVRSGRRGIREEFATADSTFEENVAWNENHVSLGFRLPFNFTRSKYSNTLLVGGNAAVTEVSGYNSSFPIADQQGNGLLLSSSYSLRYNRLLKMSKRDIFSKWGQRIIAGYEHTPFGGDYKGEIAFVETSLFNPGLFKHHSFHLRGGYQFQDVNSGYRFKSSLFYPRGYGYTAFRNFYLASVNYALPLVYPDLRIGPLFYFQRIRANIFHDQGWGENSRYQTRSFASSGLEIMVDFNFMRFLPIFSLGIRNAYLHDQKRMETQLIIGSIGI